MKIICQKKYIHLPNGEIRESCPAIPIEGAKSIITDPQIIRESEVQRQNDLETMLWAKTHGCG